MYSLYKCNSSRTVGFVVAQCKKHEISDYWAWGKYLIIPKTNNRYPHAPRESYLVKEGTLGELKTYCKTLKQ